MFCSNLLVWVKLGYPPNFNFLGKPLLYVEEKEERRRRRNNAKFSGHYVCPRTHAHSVRTNHTIYEVDITTSITYKGKGMYLLFCEKEPGESGKMAPTYVL